MLRVDEIVTVAVDKNGQPIGFSWRNESFLVSAPRFVGLLGVNGGTKRREFNAASALECLK